MSLTLLGNVIYKLTDGKSLHIPYRDSKLTRILQVLPLSDVHPDAHGPGRGSGGLAAAQRLPKLEQGLARVFTGAHKSVLESAMDSEGASGCPWSTARATAPPPGHPTPGVVKQDKSSGGSVDTSKTRSGPQRVRMCSGEGPVGAAKGKQTHIMASCQIPPSKGALLDPLAP